MELKLHRPMIFPDIKQQVYRPHTQWEIVDVDNFEDYSKYTHMPEYKYNKNGVWKWKIKTNFTDNEDIYGNRTLFSRYPYLEFQPWKYWRRLDHIRY